MSGNLYGDDKLFGTPSQNNNSFKPFRDDSGVDLDTQINDFQGRRDNKAKTTEPRSALTFSVKNPTPQTNTRSEVFRGDYESPAVMSKYTIFWWNKRDSNKQYRVVIELPHLETVIEAIRDVIPYLNQRLAEDNSNYSLLPDPTIYEFFKAKKSGLPKVDFPALDANQVISQTGIQNICLVETSIRAVVQKSFAVPSNTGSKHKQSMTSMISASMPDNKPQTAVQSIADDDYVEETVCLCFTSKKRAPTNKKNDMNTKLLSDY